MSLGERFALLVMAFEGEATDVEKQREELKHIFAILGRQVTTVAILEICVVSNYVFVDA